MFWRANTPLIVPAKSPYNGQILRPMCALYRKRPAPRRADRFRKSLCCFSSGDRTRTCDPLINSQLLYQLSYAGIDPRKCSVPRGINKVLSENSVNQFGRFASASQSTPWSECSRQLGQRRALAVRSPMAPNGSPGKSRSVPALITDKCRSANHCMTERISSSRK